MRKHIRTGTEWLGRVVTQPRGELTRWESAARFVYDLFRYGARQLRQDNAPQMAGALAYRTLFGLLPVLVVGTIIVRAFRGWDAFREHLQSFFDRLGADTIQVREQPVEGPQVLEVEETSQTLSEWLMEIVGQVDRINLTAIGWVGVAILLYSALGLMGTIEDSFNRIYRAPAGRPLGRRLMMYWTVLGLGPIAIGLMVYVNSTVGDMISRVHTWQWMLTAASVLWSFIVLWLLILLIYKLVPNTTVAVRPAVIGALVTAILLEIGRRSLGAYTENLLSLRQLYGSLGLIPLFMFWVYLMWLMVLFGLEVAATLQMLHGRRPDEVERKAEPTGLVEPASVVVVMKVIADRFAQGQVTSSRQIADATDLPETTIGRMLDQLQRAGFVHRVEQEENTVALACPPDQIAADKLIEIGFSMVQSGGDQGPWKFMQQLRQAQKTLAAQQTLANLPS